MKRAVIIIGGDAPDGAFINKVCRWADLVIAADSGVEVAAAAGVTPSVVVGDFDSVSRERSRELFPRAAQEAAAAAKDETDTELAVAYARRWGYACCDVVGGGGGRVDHLLANLALMERPDGPDRWFTNAADIRRVDQYLVVSPPEGDTVSVFPCGGVPGLARSSGLRWPLDGIVWSRGVHGVSNEVVGSAVEIWVDSGALLVVLPISDAAASEPCRRAGTEAEGEDNR